MINYKRLDTYLMKSALPYYLFIILSFIHTIINIHYKLPAIVLFNLFSLFPLLDVILSKDWINPNLKEVKEMEHSVWFQIPLYLGLALDWFMTI